MKMIVIGLAALSFAASAAASASAQEVSDVDYLQASHCAGVAAGLGSPDAAALKAYVRKAEDHRTVFVLDQGQEQFDSAQRRAGDRKDKAQAELTGVCASYTAAATQQARAPSPHQTLAR